MSRTHQFKVEENDWVRDAKESLRSALPSYLLYCLGHLLASPVLAVLGLLRSNRRHRSGINLRRLGFDRGESSLIRPIVIIAGGLGEVRTAAKVAEEILASHQIPTVILVETNEGFSVSTGVTPIRTAPFNNPLSAWLCLKRYQPRAIWAVEFWDNHHLKALCAWIEVPTMVFNVPISNQELERVRKKPRTWWRYRLVGGYAAVSDLTASRLRELRIERHRILDVGPIGLGLVEASGDIESQRSAWRKRLGIREEDGPVILAGSTHHEDEEILLKAFAEFLLQHPRAVLVLAPRRRNRPMTIEDVLEVKRIEFKRRSKPEEAIPASRIVVLDTQGELSQAYAAADIAFVGGTFGTSLGGHTPIEAVSWRLPVVYGPHFEQQAHLLGPLTSLGCAFQVEDEVSLLSTWLRLTSQESLRREIAQKCDAWISERKGATAQLYDQFKTRARLL